jgi:hypothetical protein
MALTVSTTEKDGWSRGGCPVPHPPILAWLFGQVWPPSCLQLRAGLQEDRPCSGTERWPRSAAGNDGGVFGGWVCTSRIPTPASLHAYSRPPRACRVRQRAAHSWPARRCFAFRLKEEGTIDLGESSVDCFLQIYCENKGKEFVKARYF